jgi:hypothetical protein
MSPHLMVVTEKATKAIAVGFLHPVGRRCTQEPDIIGGASRWVLAGHASEVGNQIRPDNDFELRHLGSMGEYVNAVIASYEHISFLSIDSFHAALLAILQAVASLITTSFLFCHASNLIIVSIE